MTRSLAARLTLAMTLTAAVGAVLAGVLTLPLISSTTSDAVREPLARQAELLARLPARVLASERLAELSERSGLLVGLVTLDGTAQGVATALPADAPASTTVTYRGERLLVEARPARGGGTVVVATPAAEVRTARAVLVRRILLALLVGLGVATVVALALGRRLGRPLDQVATAARRLAAGERGVPLPDASTTEVRDVVAALAGLDRALATSEARQRTFLTSVSHELRTPLTTVRGYAEGLADGVVAGPEVPEVGRTLVAEAQRMERYVADLLALARLEADDFSLEPAPVDVAAMARDIADVWRDRVLSADLTLTVDVPPTLVATTDSARLRQVVEILLDNAVRVCGSGDRVVLAASAYDGGVRVEVRDSGPGLTPEDAEVAFEPGALHRRYAGTRPVGHGLGLALAHRLVTRLGGRIAVHRAPEGGSAFVVDLLSRSGR